MKKVATYACLLAVPGFLAPMGSATAQSCRDFAVLQLSLPDSGAKVDVTGPSNVFGDLGIGPDGRGSRTGESTITGTVCLEESPLATFTESGSGGVGGIEVASLIDPIDAALSTAEQLAALEPTMVLDRIGEGDLIVGTGGLNVIEVDDFDLSGGVVTLDGGSEDVFVFNISGKFKLSGGSGVELTGGVGAARVFYNLLGTGEDVAFTGGAFASGAFIAPDRKIALSPGFVDGSVVAGKDISIVSGAEVTFVPTPCELEVSVVNESVRPGGELEYRISLLHNNPTEVRRPFRAWIEDADGQVLTHGRTPLYTIGFLDRITFEGTIRIPPAAPPGDYKLLFGIGQMKQGTAHGSREFAVVE